MGRWTQYDEDDSRLPEGMKRVGYDADTGRYYFRDKDGSLWEGPEGAEFGEMRQVAEGPIAITTGDDDVEIGQSRADGYQALASDSDGYVHKPTSPYRTLFPFFLLIAVTLLLIFRLVGPPSSTPPPPCPEKSTEYYIKTGDTCWQVCQTYGCKLSSLVAVNSELKCESLQIGQRICVPYSDS